MKIQLKRNVIVSGHPGVKKGDIVDVQPGVAAMLVSEDAAKFEYEEVIVNREPVFEQRDPIPETPQRTPAKRRRAS